jgi:hypothetical protein
MFRWGASKKSGYLNLLTGNCESVLSFKKKSICNKVSISLLFVHGKIQTKNIEL